MGSQISSLNYQNIIQIIDLSSVKEQNKFIHIIKFENGKEKRIKLNKNEEKKFQMRYKYAKMFKDISKIKYSSITSVIKTNIDENRYKILNKFVVDEEDKYIYNLKCILDDGKIQILNVNKSQYDLFCNIYYDINKIKI